MIDVSQRLAAIRGLTPLPESAQKKLDITALKKGGYVDFDDQTWKVTNIYRYLDVKWKDFKPRKQDYWVTEYELFSLNTGNSIFIEWEIDDELEIYRTDSAIKLRDISFNNATLKQGDLVYIADEEEGVIKHNGIAYHYNDDDSWAARFFKDDIDLKSLDKEAGLPVKIYEFESNNNVSLSIEAWHEEDDARPEREAFTSSKVAAKAFHVLQTESVA
jgi:translation elongation factor P/translation initiation factor 5A